jgi:tetratricopeptide (TPR) repeat protein
MIARIAHLIFFLTLGCFIGCGNSDEERQKQSNLLSKNVEEFKTQKKYREALSALHELEALFSQMKKDSLLAETYYEVGELYQEIGKYDSALIAYSSASDHAQLSFHKTLERQVKCSLSQLSLDVGKYSQSKYFAEEAARSAQFADDETRKNYALLVSARAFHQLGAFDHEIRTLDELENSQSRLNDFKFDFAVRIQKIQAYVSKKQTDKARGVYERWREYGLQTNDTVAFLTASLQWAKIHQSLGNFDSSITLLRSTLHRLENFSSDTLTLQAVQLMGMLLFQKGNYKEAKTYFHQALKLSQYLGSIAGELQNQLSILKCDLFLDPSFKKNSITAFRQRCAELQQKCEEFHLPRELSQALYLQGKAAEIEEHPATALKHYYRAIELREQCVLSGTVELANEDLSLLYSAVLDIECAVENVDGVFALSEKRILSDIVRFFSQLPISVTEAEVQRLIERYQFQRYSLALMENTIQSILSMRGENNFERLQLLHESYNAVLEEIESTLREIQQRNPKLYRLFSLQPMALAETRQHLPRQSFLIEFIPLSNVVYALLVGKDTVQLKKLPLTDKQLRTMVNSYAAVISDSRFNDENVSRTTISELRYRLESLSSELYDVLLSPIAKYLQGTSVLYLVPPEEFGFLPMHTLTDFHDRQPMFLINRYEVRYLPTASVLTFSSQQQSSSIRIAGLGHPGRTTWDVEYELKDIWSFQREAHLFFGADATLEQMKRLSGNVLHLAAEIDVDAHNPRYSRITLSKNTLGLEVHDVSIGELSVLGKIPILVVNNVSGQPGQLSRYVPMLFLACGVRTCVATFWQGDRRTKKDFGELFYTHLLFGNSPEGAYLETVRGLAKNNNTSPLYRWGVYYYFGK